MSPLGRSLVPIVVTICVMSFLFNVGQSFFDGFFSVLINSNFEARNHTQLGWQFGESLHSPAGSSFVRVCHPAPVMIVAPLQVSAEKIGLLLTSLAGVSFVVACFVYAPVVRRLGVALTCSLGLFLVALGARPPTRNPCRMRAGRHRLRTNVLEKQNALTSELPSAAPGLGLIGLMPTLPLVWVAAMVYVVVRGPPPARSLVVCVCLQCTLCRRGDDTRDQPLGSNTTLC